MELKSVGVVSVAKVMGMTNAIFGLIGGAIVSLLSVLGVGQDGGLVLGIASIIVMPIVYGIMGLITGLIAGFVYNFVAKAVGGLELNLQ